MHLNEKNRVYYFAFLHLNVKSLKMIRLLLKLVVLFLPLQGMEYWLYGSTIFFLVILGATAAKTGGSNVIKAILRVTIWGTIAMVISALVGYLFGVSV